MTKIVDALNALIVRGARWPAWTRLLTEEAAQDILAVATGP